MCVCVCVCVCARARATNRRSRSRSPRCLRPPHLRPVANCSEKKAALHRAQPHFFELSLAQLLEQIHLSDRVVFEDSAVPLHSNRIKPRAHLPELSFGGLCLSLSRLEPKEGGHELNTDKASDAEERISACFRS